MTEHSKVFTYQTDGLSYTVTVYQDPDTGEILADINVTEGSMDVNAVYFGDDDFSGKSESLSGPLNMNGARLDGEAVQWDKAAELSRPGLGPEGTDKDTYLSEGDVLTIQLDANSLDDIDVFGIRATSTTTESGSIKAVSDDPEEPETPEEPIFDKIGFGVELGEDGGISGGVYLTEDQLPEGEEGTFDNYVSLYEEVADEFPEIGISEIEAVLFFQQVEGPNGTDSLEEVLRIDSPEGGFQTADELIDAYDALIEGGALDDTGTGEGGGGLDIIAVLGLGEVEDMPWVDEIETQEDIIEIA